MKVAVFSTKPYDRRFLEEANKQYGHDLHFFETRLNEETARLAEGHEAVTVFVNDDCEKEGVEYLPLQDLLSESDVVSLHCPLTPETKHLINKKSLNQTKLGAMLINTSRGALIETKSVVEALKTGRLGALALDVYEEEGDLFFEDLSNEVIQDDVFMRLLTFPNVLITGHQAFFTREALQNITSTTLGNISAFACGEINGNELSADLLAR